MSGSLSSADLKELGDAKILAFDKRVALIPSDLCGPFNMEAGRLESELLTVYQFVALGVRKEEDLAAISASWGAMVDVCDAFAKALNGLAQNHPECGTGAYYDRVLDLRNKCNRLRKLHA